MKKRFLLLVTFVLTIVIGASAQKLSQVSSTLNLGSIYYMTKEGNTDGDGVLYDQKVIDDLEAAGYDLTQGYPGEGGAINPVELNKYDAVVVGRNISSGDFKLAEDWAELEAPVLMLSGYIVRNSRLKYLNTGSLNREATVAVESNKDRVTKALIADPDDYSFKNISATDNKMDYMTWFYDYIAYGIDSFATTNNGKLLASIVDADTADANGNVLMARWEPGKETYDGSGVTPKSYRTYLQMGADDKSDPKNMNYAQYTSASFQLILNEINYLVRTGKNVQYMVKEGNTDADDVLYDQKVIDDLKNAGYKNLVKTYPGEAGAINAAELNNADLVVVGRNISSGDFKLAEEWAELEVPVLMLSGYIVRNSRLKYLNTGSLNREATVAVESNKDRITKALVADVADSAFIGVPVGADAKMDYMTWFYDYIAYGIDSFATTNNGKLLASIVDADTTDANGNVLMARWEPGKATYEGGVTPMSYRTYLQMGADDKSDPKNMNYAQYTDASFQLMINEMDYLGSTYTPAGIVLGDVATLDTIVLSEGTLDPAFSSDVYTYTVVLPDEAGVPTVTPTATDTNAVISQIDAGEVPGITLIKVTSEDEQTELTYTISFKYDVPIGDVVPPGMGTLDEAVLLAATGDTLYLENGGVYEIISPLVIDKQLTIIAQDIPELPGLENMPVISNMFTSTQVFAFKTNCDLSIIGIDIDALGGSFIFDPMADSNYVFNLHVNRCRLHNTIDDILNDDGSYTNNITCGKLHIRNTFLYDNGTGHGIYTKFYNTNGSPWVFENLTMWNLGQQFTWIRVMADDAGSKQNITFDHMTGYNLSTSTSDNKELFGNDEKTEEDTDPEADLVIKFKNSILSTQVSTNEGSLIFKNSDGFHDITVNNNVLHSVSPLANIGTVTETDNMVDTDPAFADAANLDFTVGNADLLTAADDGKIVGALYWAPDFVDDFSDIETSVEDVMASRNSLNVNVYPNPVNSTLNVYFNLNATSNVSLSIVNINGQLVEQVNFGKLSTGDNTMSFDASNLKTGVYFYQVVTDGAVSTGKIVKN